MVRPGRLHPTPRSTLKALLKKENDATFALLIEGDADSAAFGEESKILEKDQYFRFPSGGSYCLLLSSSQQSNFVFDNKSSGFKKR